MARQPLYTVGFVCSGNTCRSPIAAAWVRHELLTTGQEQHVKLWTAGLRVESEDIGVKGAESEALVAAAKMNLNPVVLRALLRHRVDDLSRVSIKSDLLVWITDPSKISQIDEEKQLTRAAEVKECAVRLNATLLVVPEQDAAWQAKEDNAPLTEVSELYEAQAVSLRRWSWVVYRFLPGSARGA